MSDLQEVNNNSNSLVENSQNGVTGETAIVEDVLSNSDDEGEDQEEDDENDGGPISYPGTVIPDPKIDEIDADVELTSDLPDDTTFIELIHLKIGSMEDLNLARFKQLESLCLRQNLLTSMSAVKELPIETLEELDLYDNRINHISQYLNQFVNLKNLDLSFNKIKNIKNIDNLVELENLYFVQNKIHEIKGLSTFKKLKNLELGGNKIQVLNPELDLLPSLEQLWLGKNRIAKFENMTNLVNLRVLSIQSNRLTKIEGLDKLVNLEELYLSHNGITKIEGLENNLKLTTLDITSNKIDKLENLKHLRSLTDLWASYNQISSFENIGEELSSLPELDTVYFEGNPLQLSNPSAYRRKVKLYLGPSLAKIDATYIR